MKNIYVECGEVSRKENTIRLKKEGKVQWIPVRKVNEINLIGGVTLTNEFLNLTRENNIAVHLYSSRGKYNGSFSKLYGNNNGKVLYHQSRYFEKYQEELAQKVIHVLLINKLHYLDQYRKKSRAGSYEAYNSICALKTQLQNVKKEGVSVIQGIEGRSWNIFYGFLTELYEEKGFRGRNKRPPKDMINCLISFLNTLIYNRIETEFAKTNVYSEISFLHSHLQKRNSLVLDIAELYKIDVTFRIIGSLVNRRIIKDGDFENIDGQLVMSQKGLRLVIEAFEKEMASYYWCDKLKKNITLEHSLKLEAYKLIRACIEERDYEPIILSGVKLQR